MRSTSGRILTAFAAVVPVATEVTYISHALIQTKPFKVMADPPAQLFVKIALIGAICALLAVIVAVRSASSTRLSAAPVVAVSMATLLYLASYFTLTTLAPRKTVERSAVAAAAGEVTGVTPARQVRLAEAREEYVQQLGIASAAALLLAFVAGGGLHFALRRRNGLAEQAAYVEAR
jgi:hypothetical protein